MRLSNILGATIGLYACQVNAAEYSIHSSCQPIETLLEQIMTGWMPRIDKAKTELDSLGDSNVKDLATWLFGDKTSDASGHLKGFVPALNKVDHDDNILTEAKRLKEGHIAIYCGKDGVKDDPIIQHEGKEQVHMVNLNTATPLKGDNFGACFGSGSNIFAGSETLAITYRSVNSNVGSRIHICEKEFQRVKGQKYKSMADISDKIWQDIVKKPNPKFKIPFTKTAMDLLGLFDHTLVHEMMHTWVGGNADDISSSGEVDSSSSYGFKNCVGNPNGYKNADSLAFFVQGVYAIKDKGYKVRKDGWMEKLEGFSRKLARKWVA